MTLRNVTCVLLIASLCAAGCAPSYDPAAEPFTADFPGTPKAVTETISQNGMTLEFHYIGYEVDNGVFAVMYCDYPVGHIQRTGPKAVLAGARNGAAASAGGQIISNNSISLGNHVGQETKIRDTAKGLEIRNRMYLVGDRMYQVMVVAESGNAENQEAEDFLNSFELK